MAGVKGKSGGARANSGGARPGAGRKPKEPVPPAVVGECDPLAFLLSVMRGEVEANALQVRAAVSAAQYLHTKKGDGGKKDEQAEKAQKAGVGRFKPGSAPRLVSNG